MANRSHVSAQLQCGQVSRSAVLWREQTVASDKSQVPRQYALSAKHLLQKRRRRRFHTGIGRVEGDSISRAISDHAGCTVANIARSWLSATHLDRNCAITTLPGRPLILASLHRNPGKLSSA